MSENEETLKSKIKTAVIVVTVVLGMAFSPLWAPVLIKLLFSGTL